MRYRLRTLGAGWWAERRNERSALSASKAKVNDLEWKIEGCKELLADIGLKLDVGDSSIHVTGDFPDGSRS
jgi:hypothetical protein